MKQEYADAFAEVDQIFDLMPDVLLNKIPTKFKQMIKNNKSDYIPNIKEPIEECELKEETIIILSLIYRDFLCSGEKKEKLQYRDSKKIKEAEDELREKYNPDKIFKNTNEGKDKEEVALVEVKEEKWYRKIYNIIKGIFGKKNKVTKEEINEIEKQKTTDDHM